MKVNYDCEICDGTGAVEHPGGPPGNREVACEACHLWALDRPEKFYECGICDHLHPWDWNGDCRDDRYRLTWADVPPSADVLSWTDRQRADGVPTIEEITP